MVRRNGERGEGFFMLRGKVGGIFHGEGKIAGSAEEWKISPKLKGSSGFLRGF